MFNLHFTTTVFRLKLGKLMVSIFRWSCLTSLPISKHIFNKDYPINPKIFGERVRKYRIDAGLQIKELAALIGVTEDTIINWELRGVNPTGKNLKKVIDLLSAVGF